MPSIKTKLTDINSLEELAEGHSIVHKLHPMVKLLVTFFYIVVVISFGQYDVTRLLPYFFYTFIITAISEIPNKILIKRYLIALPFSLFVGISNMILNREIAFNILNISISYGVISCFSIIIKTYLTVMAVLLLIATTKINELSCEMVKLKVPDIIVFTITMIFRYIGILAEEADRMSLAYKLRAPKEKGIKIKDMGSFVGQILIRSIERSERVYLAMKCRGFSGKISYIVSKKIETTDYIYCFLMIILIIAFRAVDLTVLLGNIFM